MKKFTGSNPSHGKTTNIKKKTHSNNKPPPEDESRVKRCVKHSLDNGLSPINLLQIKHHCHKPLELHSMGGSPRDVSEEPVTWEKRKKGWRMSCDIGEAVEGLENEL